MDTDPTRQRLDQLLREAHIQKMRQQTVAAEDLCKKALELVPDDAMALEMLGDMLVERGKYEDALDAFRRAAATTIRPEVIETKVARTVLRQAEEDRERLEAQLFLSGAGAPTKERQNRSTAVLLSLICPGGGQLFKGQMVKGAILLAVTALSAFGWPDCLKLLFTVFGGSRGGEDPNGFLVVLGLVGLAVYIYSLMDAPTSTGRFSRSRGRE